MSHNTDGETAFTPAQAARLRTLGDMSDRHIDALVEGAKQQADFEDYVADEQPRATLRVVGGSVSIPCPLATAQEIREHGNGSLSLVRATNPCMWERDGNGVVCRADGCTSFANPGMELFAKVIAALDAEYASK